MNLENLNKLNETLESLHRRQRSRAESTVSAKYWGGDAEYWQRQLDIGWMAYHRLVNALRRELNRLQEEASQL